MSPRDEKIREPVLLPDDQYRFPHLLMVEASAGSGKTQALASRYVQFLLSERIPHRDISNILAVTFTNNAAREMKERIMAWLKALALGADGEHLRQTVPLVGLRPDEIKARAREIIAGVLDRYPDFQVQTIDSFCRTLYAASSLELGARPDFELTFCYDELAPQALDAMLRKAGSASGGDAELDRTIRAFLDAVNRAGGRSFLWNPRQKMEETFTGLLEIEARETGTVVFEDRSREIERLAQAIIEKAERIVGDGVAHGLEPGDPPLVRDLKNRNYLGAFDKKITENTAPFKGVKKHSKIVEQLTGRWRELARRGGLRERLALAFSRNLNSAYGPVFELFKHELEAVKRRTGVIHIDDLSKILSEFLDEQMAPEIYLRLGSRLYHFMIDEFQDTSPLQWRSLKPLIDEALAGDGSLFLVGDLKQAIYMFRRADYRIMRQLLYEIAGKKYGQAVPASVSGITGSAAIRTLDTNFRSGGVIVRYVDAAFKQNLAGLVGSDLVADDPTGLTGFIQHPLESRTEQGYVRVRHIITPAKKRPAPDDGEAEDRQEAARQALLDIVREARARGRGYGEIAVLAGRNEHLEQAVAWLNAAGVPVAASSSLDIRNRKVVAELADLLAFLDSPIDDLAFYGFVSGEVMRRAAQDEGVTLRPQDFARLLMPGKGAPAYQRFRQDRAYQRLWEKFLEPLYQKAGYYPLYGLLSLALKLFQALDRFPEESGAFIKLLETANDLEAEAGASIGRFLEKLSGDESERFSQELPEYADAVRLLTFHKSKGLGFPVAINLLYNAGVDGETEYYRKEGETVRPYYLRGEVRKAHPELEAIYNESKRENQVQKLNELYVCCTRARDELYNLVIAKAPEAFFCRLFPEQELGTKQTFSAAAVGRGSPTRAALPGAETGPAEGFRHEAWTLKRLQEIGKGEVCHAALKEIEYIEGEGADAVAVALDRAALTGGTKRLNDRAIDNIKRELTVFLRQPRAREWFAEKPGRRVLREAEFIDRYGRKARMDRVVVDPDRITLIDFKTGEPADHRMQIAAYREILAALYPGCRIDAVVAYVDSGKIEAAP
ncbi:MAG: UvrD-helicase domain-containing protein [Candidatus Edwardsbacteria bacterium]|nr:UvrD-helicase domain-containing protein [Candidatus Edwardsbacteria bacterium]